MKKSGKNVSTIKKRYNAKRYYYRHRDKIIAHNIEWYNENVKDKNTCVDCNKKIRKYSQRCSYCSRINNFKKAGVLK